MKASVDTQTTRIKLRFERIKISKLGKHHQTSSKTQVIYEELSELATTLFLAASTNNKTENDSPRM